MLMRVLISQRKVSDQCRKLLYTLLIVMVFEGILRKALLPLSMVIFFMKDMLCVASIVVLWKSHLPSALVSLKSTWVKMFFLFIPLLYSTGFKDPILAFFAFKQYLLYVVIGGLVVMSFPLRETEAFRRFLFVAALMLVPTTIVALLQNALPASHWLNTSIGGDSLEAFSAAGYLRVGSTFSFTAQYSWFLNAESFLLATSFFMQPAFDSKLGKLVKPFIYGVLLLMLAVSAFVTGGRTAVLGCGGTLAVGMALISIKRPQWFLSKGLLIIGMALFSLGTLRVSQPQYFLAYEERSSDDEGAGAATNKEKLAGRISNSFTEWTDWFWDQDAASMLLGNGLGVMSNGANQLSSYAANIRNTGYWTEGDVSTTFWEGGLYLAVLWYGFRLLMVLLCLRLWYSIKDQTLAAAASVPLGYVIIHGFVAQLGMQPPLSIWWWLAIGIIFSLHSLYLYQRANVRKPKPATL
jgi:hypothetical protein